MKILKKILILIILISITTATYSIYKIITWKKDNQKTEKLITSINKSDIIKEVKDTENTTIIPIENKEENKFNPYYDYINFNLIDIDIKKLKEINNDTKGWLYVPGTTINYPFVQTNNNSFYLDHSIDKSYNKAGWVYLDYRNNLDISEKNTILYAHNRHDNTMFGSLSKTLTNDWYNDINNHIVKLSTEYENTLWQIFSIYRIDKTNDYIKTTFKSEKSYEDFINLIKNRSEKQFNTTITTSDRIITLSTCHKDKERFVLHAKLIKYEKKEA